MSVDVQCPHCGHIIHLDLSSIRKKRLDEILEYISEKKPTVSEAVTWIMKTFGVRKNKAIEYLKDLAATKTIKIENNHLKPVT